MCGTTDLLLVLLSLLLLLFPARFLLRFPLLLLDALPLFLLPLTRLLLQPFLLLHHRLQGADTRPALLLRGRRSGGRLVVLLCLLFLLFLLVPAATRRITIVVLVAISCRGGRSCGCCGLRRRRGSRLLAIGLRCLLRSRLGLLLGLAYVMRLMEGD